MDNRALPVTACILTKNEEDRLPPTLGALRGHVERIIVLDAESADRTREVAEEYGAEVVVREWNGYVDARRHVLSLSGSRWVLMIDADEVIDSTFWDELRGKGFPETDVDAFQVRRRSVYLGRRVRRVWQPDWKTVLFKREKGRFENRSVHEAVKVDGRTERLQSEILHYSYRSVEDHHGRMLDYARLAAADLYERGKRARWFDLVVRPAWNWFQHLVLRGGFVDGNRGWMAAKSAAISVYLRYAILYERQQREKRESEETREN